MPKVQESVLEHSASERQESKIEEGQTVREMDKHSEDAGTALEAGESLVVARGALYRLVMSGGVLGCDPNYARRNSKTPIGETSEHSCCSERESGS